MNVIGYSKDGISIRIEIDGAEIFVPDDMGNRDRQMIAEWEFDDEGNRVNTIPPYADNTEPTPSPTIADYENAIQNLVDTTARERQFRDGVTLASYTASTKPNWAAEAQAFVEWRDNVWFYAYGELAKVQDGERQQPTVEEFLTEITPISWPLAE